MENIIKIKRSEMVKKLKIISETQQIDLTLLTPVRSKDGFEISEFTILKCWINVKYDDYLKLTGKYDPDKKIGINPIGEWISGPIYQGRNDRSDKFYLNFYYVKGEDISQLMLVNGVVVDSMAYMNSNKLKFSILGKDDYMYYRMVNLDNVISIGLKDDVYYLYSENENELFLK